MNRLKLGYFADGPWSHRALAKLLDDSTIEIAFICARNDAPDPVLRDEAARAGIAFLRHPRINSEEFISSMRNYGCDLYVSMSFNQIFRSTLINLPRLKTINCHAGKLPFYRGRNILNWALINDEKEFGITVHYVDEGIDTGDILLQQSYPITDDDNYSTLLERAYEGCADVLYKSIKALQSESVSPISQSMIHPFGFYCSRRDKGDERLNWRQTSREVFNFIRAVCQPGPEARTFLNDREIKINRAIWLPDAPAFKGVPGAIVGVEKDAFFVKTKDTFIKITEWSGYERPRIGDRLK